MTQARNDIIFISIIDPSLCHQNTIQYYTERFDDQLCFSIFNCFFCNLILGLSAVICSCMSRAKMGKHDFYGARSNARAANILNMISFTIFGLVVIFIVIIFIISAFQINEMNNHTGNFWKQVWEEVLKMKWVNLSL
jgi:magnesium-transporting ATPase (P-type)